MADIAAFGPAPDKGPNYDAEDLGAEFGHVVIEQEFVLKVKVKVARHDCEGAERLNLAQHIRESIEDAIDHTWAYQEDDREPGDLVQEVQDVAVEFAGDEVCSVCGQPDNSGDCDHTPLSKDELATLNAGEYDPHGGQKHRFYEEN